jgi:Ca-activated chloride channel family protein
VTRTTPYAVPSCRCIAALTAAAALACSAGISAQEPAARSTLAAEHARALLDAAADPTNAPPAERLYNAGVSMYRASEFALARELFAAAAERAKAGVAARSMYNRGTTSYAEALRAMQDAQGASPAGSPGGSGQSPQSDIMGATIQSLERSLRELKDAVRADPTDADARANAELAHRVLKELKQQQQQQQQQSGDQDQEQNQQQDPQQNQDGQQQESGQGEQPNDQEQNGQQDPQQRPQDGQQSDSNREGDRNEKSDRTPEEESESKSEPKPEPKPASNPDAKPTDETAQKADGKATPKPMTRQEVERLLQRIRDKERARLLERMERERARTQPAPKDW